MEMSIDLETGCRIASINNDRLNDLVHNGHLPFLSRTNQGRARRFSSADVVGLLMFQDLVSHGYCVRDAGMTASSMLAFCADRPLAKTVAHAKLAMGGQDYIIGTPHDFSLGSDAGPTFGGLVIASMHIFNVAHARMLVANGS